MASAGPSTKSYAEAVKSFHPLHEEIHKAYRPPRTESVFRFTTVTIQADKEDGWTDVSSMTSCSWPTAIDEMSSHGDEPEVVIKSPERTYKPYNLPEDPWHDDGLDTRAEYALATKINSTVRSQRRYDLLGPLGCTTRSVKPWHPYPSPSCHHKKARKGDIWAAKLTPIKMKHLKKKTMCDEMKDGATE